MQADILLLSILPTGANVLVRFSDAGNLRVLPARQHPVFLIKKEKKRYEKDDFLKDIKRINYYHNKENNNINCLYACATWAFNGIASDEVNEKSFLELLNYINNFKIKEKELERKKKL